ncbi:MAG: sulfite exporter TauE/SafE family protein [Candidatus Angelobacter sp.]
MHTILIVFLAGLIAGAMNAAAGGGSFVSISALIYVGIPSVSANMSSTIALYPGSLTSGWAYRRNFHPILNVSLKVMILATLAGGFGGAILLLLTPSSAFDKIIPWLLLLGSSAFAFGPWIGKWLHRYWRPHTTFLVVAQFLLGIYGGYFGGAVGIMMMAVWSLLGLQDVKAMNAVKVVLVAAANTIAVLCFALVGSVAWRETLVMLMAAALGGYAGARLTLRLSGWQIRLGISMINFAITAVFFYTRFFR